MGSRALVEEKVSNDLEENQLETQYELSQGTGEFSRGRSRGIIEHEIQWARQEIPKGGTYNWFRGAARKIE